MHNYTHSHTAQKNLSAFGWGWSNPGEMRVVTDSEGNVTILNSGIEALLPQQLPGTALYANSTQGLPPQQLIGSPYDLSIQHLLPQRSVEHRTFEMLPDGSYQGYDIDNGILIKEGDHYRLSEQDGTAIVFRADGQLSYVEDANGYRMTAGYTDNLLTSLTTSNGDSFTFSYNAQGRITAITDFSGQTLSFSYDPTGQYLVGIQDATLSVTFTYGHPYDPIALTGITYGDGTKVTYDYDEQGNLQQQTIGTGQQNLTYTYDASGGVTITDGNGASTQVLYNAEGQNSQIIDPLGRIVQFGYDAAGNLTSITSSQGYTVSYTYDAQGNLQSSVDPLGQTVHFTYAPNGQIQGYTDARGNGLSYGYDAQGNLQTITYADGSQQQFDYDTSGRLTHSTNRREQDITYVYNEQYQLAQQLHEDGSSVSYTYDSTSGLLETMTDSKGTTEIDYDQVNNQLAIRYATGRSLTYTFDNMGRRTQLVSQDSANIHTVNYTYDAASRLDKLTDGAGKVIVDYDYDPGTGRLVKEVDGNGTYTTYSYDAAGQLISLSNYAANGMVNSQFDYTYDNLGLRAGMTTLDGTWTYTYDVVGQLTRAVFTSTNPSITNQDLTYVYDAAGNRIRTIENGVTAEYQTNNLNEYTSAEGATYAYDADGNLVSKAEAGKTWSYTYDAQNRLKSVIDPDNNQTEYEYDVFGNRSATIYNDQRTEYLVDPFGSGNVIAEYDGSSNLIAQYSYGIGLVSRTDGSNTTTFYDFDGIGSTVGLTGTAGTILNQYSYRPFGEDISEVETVANSFEYVGQWGVTEEANGLDFMRARYYDSNTGRFIAMDPTGLQGRDTNLYRYVANNPVSYVDPEGTVAPIVVGVFATAAGLATGVALGYFGGSGDNATVTALGIGAGVGLVGNAVPGLGAFGAGLALGLYVGKNIRPSGGGDNFTLIPPAYARDAESGFDQATAQGRQPIDPLVLDLDGDGIELTSVDNHLVRFDVDGDGFREASGWVQSDDGLLVIDRNGDGFINDISELFGNQTTSGFVHLRAIDDNADGFIDSADVNYSQLQVWRDLDSDGRSDVNELFTLNELNISRIRTAASSSNVTNAGNRIVETSSFQLTDGTQRETAAVWFSVDQLNSYYDHRSTFNNPVIFTEEILSLPNLRGYGNLPDLQVAVATDEQLLALVRSLTEETSGDVASAGERISSILFRWAGVDGIAATSRGSNVNAQELGFLEKFVGRSYPANLTITAAAGQTLSQTFAALEGMLAARLLAQVTEVPVEYNASSDQLVFNGDTNAALLQLEQAISQSVSSPSAQLDLEISVLKQLIGEREEWILGSGSSEQLVGSTGEDRLYGFSGNDTLTANGGNDTIDAGSGNDTLDGGMGSDTLIGGLGNDTLNGYEGNDTYRFGRGDGQDVINDLYQPYYLYNGGTDTLVFGEGITRTDLSWNFDGTNLTFSVAGSSDQLTIRNITDSNQQLEQFVIAGETISLSEVMTSWVGTATTGADNLAWNQSAIVLDALAGDDTITTGDYADKLYGGDGNDTINSGSGNDTIDAGSGNDTLFGGNGQDTLIGGLGNDTLNGYEGNDTYRFGRGDGQDVINDLYQPYYLYNGGTDTLVFGEGITRADLSWSFDGKDLVFSVAGSSDRVTIRNITDSNQQLEQFVIAGETISLSEVMTSWVGTATTGADNLAWNQSAIVLDALAGDDTITTGDYADKLYGGSGNDTLNTNGGNDTIDAGSGNDTLFGGNGQDTLIGGLGNDTLNGYEGNDTYRFGRGDGQDVINDLYQPYYLYNGGTDTLVFGEGITRTDLSWNFDGTNLTFSVAGSSDQLTIRNITDSNQQLEQFVIAGETISLSEVMTSWVGTATTGADNLAWNQSAIVLDALAGDDTITTGDYADKLYGGDGNDTINSGSGNDTIDAGSGNDTLFGGMGSDTLIGGTGNDTLDGGMGSDTLIGGTGNDTYFVDSTGDVVTETSTTTTEIDSVTATIGYTLGTNLENLTLGGSTALNGTGNGLNNLMTGNGANNLLSGLAGNDTLNGVAGDDTLDGGDGNDRLGGGDGNDRLLGGLGTDTLLGGLGNDILVGGAGNDVLTGNEGSDLFLYDTNAVFSASAFGIDRISDFLINTDKIVLDKTTFTALASIAGSGFSVKSEFAVVANDAAAATTGASIAYSSATGNLFYNQNGAAAGLGSGSQFATLTGTPGLTVADFIIQA